ncbi:MAG: hypothetical protein ACLFOY_15400 [Desulfatibacillaceae bacterium]
MSRGSTSAVCVDCGLPDTGATFRGLLGRLGYGGETTVPRDVYAQSRGALDTALAAARPRVVYRILEVDSVTGREIIAGRFVVDSRRWARVAAEASPPMYLAVACATLGPGLDETIALARAESLGRGYMMDAAGTGILESVADAWTKTLGREPGLEGLSLSRRFSPGYCDWPLESQKQFAECLPMDKVGVACTRAWAMVPAKTVTAAVLAAESLTRDCPCAFCPESFCDHRRANREANLNP